MYHVDLRQHFAAPIETVFAAVTDHGRMGEWLAGAKVSLVREGDPAPNGLGAVRRVGVGGAEVDEAVCHWKAPTEMDYQVVRGGPLRDHLGQIRLQSATDGGTDLHYTIRYTVPWTAGGPIVGHLLRLILTRQLGKGLALLATRLPRSA